MTSVLCPIDGTRIAEVPPASAADVDAAFARAGEAAAAWRRVPATERGRLLHHCATLLRREADDIATLETRNVGKTLSDTRREALRAAGCFAYYAGYADKVTGTTVPADPGYHTVTEREPHGVAVGIIPWNVPYFFAAKKIAPALAFGNACLLKPAEETPLSALRLAELLAEAGLPDGLVHVLPGGAEVGQRLVDDPRADLLVFTGFHETGRRIAAAAARHLTPVCLELGGKSPQIVFADADLDRALDHVLLGVFGAAGQMCVAGSRLLVQREVAERFTARVVERVNALRVGDPRDPATSVGPQVTARQRDKTMALIDSGVRDGARVAAQAPVARNGPLADGFYAPPTVFTQVRPDMRVVREEVFGPVLAVLPFDDEADALRLAADTEFGLAAGVWTRDIGRAHRVAAELAVGTVWINSYRVLSDLVPFGGLGLSGYGRENGEEAARLYTRTKAVWTALTPGPPPGYRL